MKTFFKPIFFFFLLLSVGLVQAKPLEVIYNDKVTTKFTWKWPYHTRQTKNYMQTKPYFYTGRLIDLTRENVSKYRFYYTQKVCKNDWGYYFHPGDKLCVKNILTFPQVVRGNEVHLVPRY